MTRGLYSGRPNRAEPGNLVSLDPTDTMNKGFFMVIAPPSRGTHMLSANWDIGYWELQAALTITIEVR